MVHEHLKSKSKEILNTSKLPEPQDLRIVNIFFFLFRFLFRFSPIRTDTFGIYKYATSEVKNAKQRYESERQKNENAERYLAIDEHKTGNIYMARVTRR